MEVILLNEEEAMYLTGKTDAVDALEELLLDCPTVVIKRGSDGAIGKARGSMLIQVDAVSTEVVDTTGAGDSFAAGFMAHYTLHKNMQLALEAGAAVAARCVAIVGARPRVGTVI
jgi:sugar/nucleoside kinase (ribokinase family)